MNVVAGSWALVNWRRIQSDGAISLPLGDGASGILIYAPDGYMATQMAASRRPLIDSSDPVGGPIDQRAQAYGTCLAYFGTYRVLDDHVEHAIDASLYPNWSGQVVKRFYTITADELLLKTPPTQAGEITIVNELRWRRAKPAN